MSDLILSVAAPRIVRRLRLAIPAAALLVTATAAPLGADEALRWNRVATEVAAAAETDPLTESRIFSLMHLAMHDAVNAIDPRFERYSQRPIPAAGASAEAAAAAAAHGVLLALLPKGVDTFNATLTASLRGIPEGEPRARGIDIGRRIARRLLAQRRHDGADAAVALAPRNEAGRVPADAAGALPGVRCRSGAASCRSRSSGPRSSAPDAPPALTSEAYAADVAEVAAVGSATSTVRTAEQTEIAKYWYENTTQGWNRIAREVVAARGLDAWESARLFALVNVAIADGFIAGFETKYHYNFWRPVTAIRAADDDGNAATGADASWLSALPTPPVPDYTSTHTVTGSAAARVLARVLGTDYVAFTMTSGAPYAGLTRRFTSFSQAAYENGQSRVLAGVHFGAAVRAGYQQGEAVGTFVADTLLRPRGAEGALTAGTR